MTAPRCDLPPLGHPGGSRRESIERRLARARLDHAAWDSECRAAASLLGAVLASGCGERAKQRARDEWTACDALRRDADDDVFAFTAALAECARLEAEPDDEAPDEREECAFCHGRGGGTSQPVEGLATMDWDCSDCDGTGYAPADDAVSSC